MIKQKSKTALCLLLLFTAALFSACMGEGDRAAKTVIEMEMTADYDNSDPFIHEKLFYLPGDVETLELQASFQMKGETSLLEIADNETKAVFWNKSWSGNTDMEDFTLSLDDLENDRQYVIRLTGTGIEHAKVTVTADESLVKERSKPVRSK